MYNKQHAFINTNTDIFTPSYIGNINVSDGKIYKSNDKQNEILIPNNYPESIIYTSQFFTDWCHDEIKTLPYQLNDILLQPNELVHAHVLNSSFEKLFTNIEYILSRCLFFTNTVPTEYVGWFGCALNMQFITTGNNAHASYSVDNEYKFHGPIKACYQYFPCKYASTSGWTTENDFISSMNSRIGAGTDDNYKFSASGSDNTDILSPSINRYPNGLSETTAMSAYANAKYALYDDIMSTVDITTKAGKKYSLFVSSSGITFQQLEKTNNIQTPNDYGTEIITTSGYTITEDISKRITHVNGHTFKQIISVSISDTGYLYVYDAEYNMIYQYNLKYLLNDDKILNEVYLINAIGGRDITEQHLYKFDKLKFIKCSGNHIFAYDESEHNIIVFDEHLNYVRYIGNTGFMVHPPVDITYRQLQKEYYILCNDGKIYVLSSEFRVIREYQLYDSETNNYKTITSSTIDSNVYYIALSDSMLQKLYSNNKTVGNFTFSKFGITNDSYKWWRSTNIDWNKCLDLWSGTYNFPSITEQFEIKSTNIINVNGKDEIMIFVNNGRLIWLINDIKQQSLLHDSEILRYNKDDLQISEQDYLQSFTYNKIIRRFIDILNSIAAHIVYQPVYTYDPSGNLIFNKLSYITSKINVNDAIKNLKIYDNDILTTDVINRVFTHLFDLQQQLLDKTQIKKTNSKYQKNTSLIIEI